MLSCLLTLGLEHLQVTDQNSLPGQHPHHLLICLLALGLEHLQVTSSVCGENRQVTDPLPGHHQHHLIMGWNSDLQNCMGLCLGITSFAHVFVGVTHLQSRIICALLCWLLGWNICRSLTCRASWLCPRMTALARLFVGSWAAELHGALPGQHPHHLLICVLALVLQHLQAATFMASFVLSEHLQVTDLHSFMGLCLGIARITCSFVCWLLL